jgi:putative hemolysin
MNGSVFLGLLGIAVLAWLTAAATALRSVSRIWLRAWVERGPAGAGSAEIYLERPHRLIASASAGGALVIALSGLMIGWRGYPDAAQITVGVLVLAVAMLVLGQQIPRAIARRWPTHLLPILLPFLQLFAWLVYPIVRVSRFARALVRGPAAVASDVRDGIGDLLREGELEGIGAREELRIISGVVEFGEKTLRDVMTPRTEIFAIDVATPPHEAAQAIAQAGYSRVPVYRDSLDEIVGIVHVFDVLREAGERMPPIRPVAHAPASKRCSEMLFEMLRWQRHMAIVLDEFGGTAGLVSLEDMLEELVGDIRDEHDEPATAELHAVSRPAIVDASAEWVDVAARFQVDLESVGDARGGRSIGGVLVRALGRIPQVGERFRIAGLDITVVQAEPSRLLRLLVQRADSAAPVELPAPR